MENKSEWYDGNITYLSNKNYFSHYFLCLGVFENALFSSFWPYGNQWSEMSLVEIKFPSFVFLSYYAYNEEKPNNLLYFCVKIQILNHHLLFCHWQTFCLLRICWKNVPMATTFTECEDETFQWLYSIVKLLVCPNILADFNFTL